MSARINVPCNGNAGNNVVNKVADTITFGTSGNCKFISFQFTPTDPAPGFSNKTYSPDKSTVSYDYDGSAIPASGDFFTYTTTTAAAGNGTGVIKN